MRGERAPLCCAPPPVPSAWDTPVSNAKRPAPVGPTAVRWTVPARQHAHGKQVCAAVAIPLPIWRTRTKPRVSKGGEGRREGGGFNRWEFGDGGEGLTGTDVRGQKPARAGLGTTVWECGTLHPAGNLWTTINCREPPGLWRDQMGPFRSCSKSVMHQGDWKGDTETGSRRSPGRCKSLVRKRPEGNELEPPRYLWSLHRKLLKNFKACWHKIDQP